LSSTLEGWLFSPLWWWAGAASPWYFWLFEPDMELFQKLAANRRKDEKNGEEEKNVAAGKKEQTNKQLSGTSW
jgi:hypothetical protein